MSKPKDKILNRRCHEYYDGMFNSNYLNSMKGIITTLDNYLREWQQKRSSWKEVQEMFTEPSLAALAVNFRPIYIVSYYWFTIEPSDLLLKELNINSNNLSLVTFCSGVVFSLFSVFMYFKVVNAIQVNMVMFYTTLQVMPISILKRNQILAYRLRKVKRGEDFYKIE